MTTQQSFKRRIRARMEKTGESYTAARAQLLPPEYVPRIADAKVEAATGHVWRYWFDLLDAWGAIDREHRDIAAWIRGEHGVPGWWAQNVTVEYEKARGLRPVGGDRDGTYNVSASKTIAVPVERLFEAWSDAVLRERWLGEFDLHERTSTPPRGARYDWEGGSSRVIVLCESKGESKSTVALSHERLHDAGEAARLKEFWRGRMSDLKVLLETAPISTPSAGTPVRRRSSASAPGSPR